MIFRILFLTIFGILSVSCSSSGDKSSSESTTTASQDNPESTRSAEAVSSRKTSRTKITKPLELPPDLVDSSNIKVQENTDPFAELNVLPDVIGARINKQDEKTWLEIDTDVESVWKTISEYWATNGVSLVDYDPESGTMETEWIETEIALNADGSVVKQLFKSLLGTVSRNTASDKYRIRFERVEPNKTAMFVSHRATERVAIESPIKATIFEWVEMPSDPERVADFLQNIVFIFDQSA